MLVSLARSVVTSRRPVCFFLSRDLAPLTSSRDIALRLHSYDCGVRAVVRPRTGISALQSAWNQTCCWFTQPPRSEASHRHVGGSRRLGRLWNKLTPWFIYFFKLQTKSSPSRASDERHFLVRRHLESGDWLLFMSVSAAGFLLDGRSQGNALSTRNSEYRKRLQLLLRAETAPLSVDDSSHVVYVNVVFVKNWQYFSIGRRRDYVFL